MKVLILSGSPHPQGNLSIAIDEMIKVFEAQGVETEVIRVGNEKVNGCMGCMGCLKAGKCVIDDIVNEIAPKLDAADGLVLASPVHFASADGALTSVLDRLFFSTQGMRMTGKVGASIVAARRGGCASTFDQLNKYLAYKGFAIAGSQYWNFIHGQIPGDAARDAEGLQTMRTLAENMVFFMKSIALGKEAYGLPELEVQLWTNNIPRD